MKASDARVISKEAEHSGVSELIAVYECIAARSRFGHRDTRYSNLTEHEVAKLQELGNNVVLVFDCWCIDWSE